MAHVVTALMALVDRTDNTTVTVMRGGPVPDDVTPGHLKHLLTFDLVEEVPDEIEGGVLETPYVGEGAAPVASGAPAKVATKDVWVSHAVEQGMSQEDAEALTKDQLIEKFGA